MKLFFKLFLFLENLQNGFFTFLISAFDQKLHRETYTQFSDFHDFGQWIYYHFLKEFVLECERKSWKSENWVYVSRCNFWSKVDTRNTKKPLCRFSRNKKSLKNNFTKKLILRPLFELKSMGFSENHDFRKILKNTIFSTLESEKMLENDFFDPEIIFPKKYATSAPEWYIYIGHTSNTLASRLFWTENVYFQRYLMFT